MAEYLEKSLQSFRSCFFKERAFRWFVLVILMFILREDHLGVTSTIRALSLNHGCYDTLIHFFHSSAYQTQMVRLAWYRFVRDSANFLLADGRTILIGDGVKQSKEARYMPGVKKLHQETSRMVQASAQSEMMRVIQGVLTEEEHAVYRRGRNAKSVSPARNQSLTDYRRATGFEALIGWLYLKSDWKRIIDLVKIGLIHLDEMDAEKGE